MYLPMEDLIVIERGLYVRGWRVYAFLDRCVMLNKGIDRKKTKQKTLGCCNWQLARHEWASQERETSRQKPYTLEKWHKIHAKHSNCQCRRSNEFSIFQVFAHLRSCLSKGPQKGRSAMLAPSWTRHSCALLYCSTYLCITVERELYPCINLPFHL